MISNVHRSRSEVISETSRTDGMGWIALTSMLLARFFFGIIAQALIAWLFFISGNKSPWNAAAPWWMVYGSLIDLGCLAVLSVLTKKEGVALLGLAGYDPKRKGKDIITGLAYFPLFFVITMVFTVSAGFMLYGSFQPPSSTGKLPMIAGIYAVLFWPILWAITEQLTYQGYTLPRMEKLVGRRWIAILVVSFSWGLQHITLPIVFDWRFMALRFIGTFPLAILMTVLFLRKKRLIPFIVAHWGMDFTAALTGVFLPSIMM